MEVHEETTNLKSVKVVGFFDKVLSEGKHFNAREFQTVEGNKIAVSVHNSNTIEDNKFYTIIIDIGLFYGLTATGKEFNSNQIRVISMKKTQIENEMETV